MDITAITQFATAVMQFVFVVVIAAGYYFLFKVGRDTLDEMRAQRTAVGRPQILVDDDYDRLPEVDVVVRNVSQGAARDITFEFSAPVESSGGFVVSDLPHFKYGMDFLAPGGEISSHWDHLGSLLPHLRQKGLEGGIVVTTTYWDMAGEQYASRWRLNPFVYESRRYVRHTGMGDLVEAVEGLSEDAKKISDSIDRLASRPESEREDGARQQAE
jgi:hypothetical protein